jgi:hypothetical protein
MFERGLCPRNPSLGEVSEGAVSAPSDGDGGEAPLSAYFLDASWISPKRTHFSPSNRISCSCSSG